MTPTASMIAATEDAESVLEGLTELQRNFVMEMMVSPNAASAYRRAGGKASTPASEKLCVWRLLVEPSVAKALQSMRARRRIRTVLEIDWIIERLLDVIERCMQGVPVLDSEGNETGQWKFDSAGANRALDMLMRHAGGYERDNRQKTTQDYDAARERMRQRGIDPDKIRSLPGGN